MRTSHKYRDSDETGPRRPVARSTSRSRRMENDIMKEVAIKVDSILADAAKDPLDSTRDGAIASDEASRKKSVKPAVALVYLLIFLFAGPSLIITNKHILRGLELPFPLSLTFFTLMFSSGVCVVSVHVFNIPLKRAHLVNRKFFIKNLLPIGALSASTIVFGMSSYLFLTVAFVQMLKAFTPFMTMVLGLPFGLQRPSRNGIVCIVLICAGTAIAGYGELNFSITGVTLMLFAQACEALKLIYTQKILQNFKFDVFETMYFVMPVSALWIAVAAVFLEWPALFSNPEAISIILDNFPTLVLAGGLAFATNVINAFVIQLSSALTLKLVATARNAALVLFTALVLLEPVTALQFVGYSISLSAFMAYNYFKVTGK